VGSRASDLWLRTHGIRLVFGFRVQGLGLRSLG
jgi:hypothetical protein